MKGNGEAYGFLFFAFNAENNLFFVFRFSVFEFMKT